MRGFYTRGTKLSIKYKGGEQILTKLRKCDYEEFSMFLLGMFKEAYESTDKGVIYTKAVKEILTNYLKDMECKKSSTK
jgi:hypothetical protein